MHLSFWIKDWVKNEFQYNEEELRKLVDDSYSVIHSIEHVTEDTGKFNYRLVPIGNAYELQFFMYEVLNDKSYCYFSGSLSFVYRNADKFRSCDDGEGYFISYYDLKEILKGGG